MEPRVEKEGKCKYLSICGSCVALEYPYECCYWDSFLTSKKCPLHSKIYRLNCPEFNPQRCRTYLPDIESKMERILNKLRIQNLAKRLPSAFVPEIRPTNPDMLRSLSIVKAVEHPIIAISLSKFFSGRSETKLLRKARSKGLHNFLNFKGDILITTDVQDELCDNFIQNIDYFIKLINDLKPDYMTTLDSYTYYNIPAIISRTKMAEILSTADRWKELECQLIGLILGANMIQIQDYITRLVGLGFQLIAYPCYELRVSKMHTLLRTRINFIRQNFSCEILVLSCTPDRGLKRVYANYYSSWSWFPFQSKEPLNAGKVKLKKFIRNCEINSKQKVRWS